MGQYRQWLHYQEIDQRLQKTRDALEAELAQIERQLDLVFLEQLTHEPQDALQAQDRYPLATNPILSTLLASLPELPGEQPLADIAPPMLPVNGRHERHEQHEQHETSSHEIRLPAPSNWDDLLPADMSAIFDAHSMTDPQLELPWWLRKITDSQTPPGIENRSMTDPGSARTNKLVQRWIDRWGRQTSIPEEDGGRSDAS